MEQFKLITQQSPGLILVCLFIGVFYAFLLYQRKSPWGKYLNWGLAVARFLTVTVVCILLLLNPLIRQIINTEEKPTVVFAIDNSVSIPNVYDTTTLKNLYTGLDKIAKKLKKREVEIDVQDLDQTVANKEMATIPLNFQSTNLSKLLSTVQNNYENRNLDKVVLVSDGIYNQGISPAFMNYNFSIHTVALGDTTPKKDLKLKAVLANKVAYLGNKFPVVAEIENIGYPNRIVNAYLTQNGRLLDKKTVNFENENQIKQVTFYTTAKLKGMQHYAVNVDVLEGEFTNKNNARDVYIEVIDGKEKVLLIAASPHPDIKAIRSAVEKNENYSFDIHIPGINTLKTEKYDLVIFHQVPSLQGVGNNLINQFRNVSKWFILGSQSNLNIFNQVNKSTKVIGRIRRMDEVTPVYNKLFNKFTFEGNNISLIEKLPPLSVPFADYTISNNTEVILSQRVGNITTEKPLLVVNQTGNIKDAVLMGEGMWQWRQEAYALGDSHESFDDLISKLIQFLSTKEDKRKLRVYPINTEFFDFEKVVFESELYNEIYERVYDQKINLSIKDESGKTSTYTFTSSEGNTRFEISGLKKGVYTYVATANIQGNVETSTGQFTIKDLQLEALNNTANHNLLRQLSQKTKGSFFTLNQLGNLEKMLLQNKKPNIIHSTEDLSEVINLKWIFFLLLGFLTIEWVLRKYQGSY